MSKVEGYTPVESLTGIKLNGNECFYNIAEEALEEMKERLLSINFNRYPQNDADKLKEKYAIYAGIKKENIIVGNGSDEMLALIIGAYIKKGKKLLTINPDFSMYDFYVNANEGEIIKLDVNEDCSFDTDKFIEFGKKENVDLIMFSNPNNPTGFAKSKKEIKKIVEGFKDKIVVIDEAYIEFYGESIIDEIENMKNLIVTRTLSKAFGGAAFRIGFLIANEELVESLKPYKVPYNVNTLSQEFGSILLDKVKTMEKYRNEVLIERERVFAELRKIENKANIKFYRSNANFIFGRGDKSFLEKLSKNEILIRNFNDDTFRITIGSQKENNLLINILKESLINE